MLYLSDVERKELTSRHALSEDDDGDEVLSGLTVGESHFVMAFQCFPFELHTTAEGNIYLQLHAKHISGIVFEHGKDIERSSEA